MDISWRIKTPGVFETDTEHGPIFVHEGAGTADVNLPWSAHTQLVEGTTSAALRFAETSLADYSCRTATSPLNWSNIPDVLGGCLAVATSPFGDVRVVMQKSDDALSYTVLFWNNQSAISAPTIQHAQEQAEQAYLYVVRTEAEKLGLFVKR